MQRTAMITHNRIGQSDHEMIENVELKHSLDIFYVFTDILTFSLSPT